MIRHSPISLLFVLLVLPLTGCLVIENPHTKLAPGVWRGVLKLDPAGASVIGGSGEQRKRGPIQFEEVTAGELPFLFEVVYTAEDSFYIVLINGEERIEAHDIHYGLDRSTAKDTLRVNFPLMDTRIEAICESGVIQGHWVVNYKEEYAIPFEARFGQGHRFTTLQKPPTADISGEWAVRFAAGEEHEYPGIAEFRQEGNHLLGTFRTETGDYRFLEGTVQANKLYLSSFDGSHAFLFEGKIMEDGSLQGLFRSGSHYLTFWEAKRAPDFRLASPDSLTLSTLGDRPLEFEFTDTEGRKVSSRDPEFAGRPLLLSIMGTWCPNCLDESRFLKTFLEENPDLDIAVVGIGFERYREEDKALAALRRYREKLELPYPLLYGGYYSKKEAATHVPFLSNVIAYPTMIFTDRSHRIVRIHTGFDGPATSKYQDFRTEFHNFVHLLAGPSQ